jgi:hypothetical protein
VTRLLRDLGLTRRVALFKTQENVDLEAQAATDSLYSGQLHRLRRIHDENGNIRGETLDTVQVAPLPERHFVVGRFNSLGPSFKRKFNAPPHGMMKSSPGNFRPNQFSYNQAQPGKLKSRVPPMAMGSPSKGIGKENFGGQFAMTSPFKGHGIGKPPMIRRPGHPILEHPGKKVATDEAFMEAVKILKGQQFKRAGARSASAPVSNAKLTKIAGAASQAGGTASRAAQSGAESQRGAAPTTNLVERFTNAVPKVVAPSLAVKDRAALADKFRAGSSLFASRWAPAQLPARAPEQLRAPEPEPELDPEPDRMSLDLAETPDLFSIPPAPQAAPPRAPVAETPKISVPKPAPPVEPSRAPVTETTMPPPVRPRRRVPSDLTLETSRWAVPELTPAFTVQHSAPEESSQGPEPAEGRLAPPEFSSSDEEMVPQPSPGHYEATEDPMAKATLAPGYLYALSLGNAVRSDPKILDMAEQFMMDD